MKTPFWYFISKPSRTLLPRLGLAFVVMVLTGCATAKLPAGPDISRLKSLPDKPKIAVGGFTDTRASEEAGSIGALTVKVRKTDLETSVTAHAIQCLNGQLDLNVVNFPANKNENVRQLASSCGAKYVLLGTITRLGIHSADAIMEAVKSELEGEVYLYDGEGKELFRSALTGKSSDHFGLSTSAKRIGKLVDATAGSFAHDLGSKIHDSPVLADLK